MASVSSCRPAPPRHGPRLPRPGRPHGAPLPSRPRPLLRPAAYLVVADEAYGRQVPFAFLDRVKEEFEEKYAEKGRLAPAHSLDRTFGCVRGGARGGGGGAHAWRECAAQRACMHAAACPSLCAIAPPAPRCWSWLPAGALARARSAPGCPCTTATCCAAAPRRPRLKSHMEYCMAHPEEISKISAVQRKVRPRRPLQRWLPPDLPRAFALVFGEACRWRRGTRTHRPMCPPARPPARR